VYAFVIIQAITLTICLPFASINCAVPASNTEPNKPITSLLAIGLPVYTKVSLEAF